MYPQVVRNDSKNNGIQIRIDVPTTFLFQFPWELIFINQTNGQGIKSVGHRTTVLLVY